MSMDAILASFSRAGFASYARLVAPQLSILIFHRVVANPDPLFPSEPDAKRFDRLMRFVAKTFNVMPLGDAAAKLSTGTLPKQALSITFDDGYADNAEIALPILQRYGLTATFFVASGFLDGGLMWNDAVIEAIRNCKRDEVDLSPLGLGHVVVKSIDDRRKALGELLPRIKYTTLAERKAAIAQLNRCCDISWQPSNLMMRSDQVQQLHSAGMEIGGHTINHPILTTLSAAEAESEITGNRQALESLINAPVEVFAYPNGRPERDYDQIHVTLLRQVGFRAAVSTAQGVCRTGDDLFQLPRFTPWSPSMSGWALQLLANQRQRRFATAQGS